MIAIGIDGGGTHTRVRSSIGPEVMGAASNVTMLGVERSSKVLLELIGRLRLDRRVPLRIVAGIAGAADDSLRLGLERALEARLKFRLEHLEVMTDADIALDAAHGVDRPGMAAIAGTGSIALLRAPDGSVDRCGGWGPALGDLGGGYRIGLAGLTALADAIDGGPATLVAQLAGERLGISDASALRAYAYGKGASPAGFAPIVLDACEQSDLVALAILGGQVEDLASRVIWLSRRHPSATHSLCLFGGLAKRLIYREAFLRALHSFSTDWTALPATASPVEAALKRAMG